MALILKNAIMPVNRFDSSKRIIRLRMYSKNNKLCIDHNSVS